MSGRHLLDAIIANRRCCAKTRGNIVLINNVPLFRGVAPNAGKAVRLKLKGYRVSVDVIRIRPLRAPYLRLDTKDLLYVMTNLVSKDVSLSKLTGSAESCL